MYSYLKKLYKSLGRLFLRWPRDVENRMKPIVEAIKKNDHKKAGIEIARISLDICVQVEDGSIEPAHADRYYTYLINSIDLPSTPLQKKVKALILEGNALHNYRRKFGADLGRMRKLANEIIENKP